eukprot:g338.t1
MTEPGYLRDVTKTVGACGGGDKYAVAYTGLETERAHNLSIYAEGLLQQNLSYFSQIHLPPRKTDADRGKEDSRDFCNEYQTILEMPILSHQDLADRRFSLEKLYEELRKAAFPTVRIIVQEAFWPMHYKSIKPVGVEEFGLKYEVDGLVYILCDDVDKKFIGGTNSCEKLCRLHAKGDRAVVDGGSGVLHAPLSIFIDWLGARVRVVAEPRGSKVFHTQENMVKGDLAAALKALAEAQSCKNISPSLAVYTAEDQRVYCSNSISTLPTLPPLPLFGIVDAMGQLIPHTLSKEIKFVSLPLVDCEREDRRLVNEVTKILSFPQKKGGFLSTRKGDLLFYRGGEPAIEFANQRATKLFDKTIVGDCVFLPRYIISTPCLFKFRREALSSSTATEEDSPDGRRLSADAFTLVSTPEVNRASRGKMDALFSKNLERAAQRLESLASSSHTDSLESMDVASVVHDYGLNMRHLGLVRQKSENSTVRIFLLAECLARTFRADVLHPGLRSMKCLHDEHVYENRERHLGRAKPGTSLYNGIIDWLDGHARACVILLFNKFLGHSEKRHSRDKDRAAFKLLVSARFPGSLTLEEMNAKESALLLYPDLRKLCFRRAQVLTGCHFVRVLSGSNPLGESLLEEIVPRVKRYEVKLSILNAAKLGATVCRIEEELVRLQASLGQSNERTINCLYNLSQLLSAKGELRKRARELLESACDTLRKDYGVSSSVHIGALLRLCTFHLESGDYAEAGGRLAVAEKSLGDIRSSLLGNFLVKQAEHLRCIGSLQEAVATAKNAVSTLEDIYGLGEAEVFPAYHIAAELAVDRLQLDEADAFLEKVLDIIEVKWSKTHSSYAKYLVTRSRLESAKSNDRESKTSLDAALPLLKFSLGENHPEAGLCATALVHACLQFEALDALDLEKMRAMITFAKDVIRQRYNESHISYQRALRCEAALYVWRGQPGAALKILSTCAEHLMKNEKNPEAMSARYDLAECSIQCSKFVEAESLLLLTVKQLQLIYGPEHPRWAMGLDAFARLRFAQGKYFEVIKITQAGINVLASHAGLADCDKVLSRLRLQRARVLIELARYNEADECLQGSCTKFFGQYMAASRILCAYSSAMSQRNLTLTLTEIEHGIQEIKEYCFENHLTVMRAELMRGRVLSSLSKFGRARSCLESAEAGLTLLRRETGVDLHLDHVEAMICLGELELSEASYESAASMLRRGLTGIKEIFSSQDEYHPLAARTTIALARTLMALAQYSEARDAAIEAQKMITECLGKYHPLNFDSVMCQAQLELECTSNVDAETITLLKSFPSIEKISKGRFLLLQGTQSMAAGDGAAARDRLEMALRSLNESFPVTDAGCPQVGHHTLCAMAAARLASVITTDRGFSTAHLLFRQAIRVQQAIDDRHPDFAELLWRYGRMLMLSNMNADDIGTLPEDARPPLQPYELVVSVDAKTGEQVGKTLTRRRCDRTELAKVSRWDIDDCRAVLGKAQEILEDKVGTNHPAYADFLLVLADFHSDAGLYLWAIEIGKQAVSIYRRFLGQTPRTAQALRTLASIYTRMSQYENARLLLEEALWICEKYCEEKHPGFLAVRLDYVKNHAKEGTSPATSKELLECVVKSLDAAFADGVRGLASMQDEAHALRVHFGIA